MPVNDDPGSPAAVLCGNCTEWGVVRLLHVEPLVPNSHHPRRTPPITADDRNLSLEDLMVPDVPARPGVPDRSGTGVTADLLDPLRACFRDGDAWLEHGVVEHRLRQIAPAVFARHVAEVGHSMFGPASNSASKRIAHALRSLRSRGEVHHFTGASTGRAWRGSTIGHWGLDPSRPRTDVLSWARLRAQLGMSDDWTGADRVGLISPTQQHGGR